MNSFSQPAAYEGLSTLRDATSISLLFLLFGCASLSSENEFARTFFPFADRPTEEVKFQHDIQVVKGEVYHFRQDGSRLTHHYIPMATVIDDRNTYVISVSSVLDVSDFMSLEFDAEEDVQAMIAVAETFCEQTGYNRVDDGVDIWVGAQSSALVEFCVPEGIELPPFYVSGDRVPRSQ